MRRSLLLLPLGLLMADSVFAYSQSYLTYWETEIQGNDQAWYNFVVANTGSADYSTTTSLISSGPPLVEQTRVYNEIPVITSYVLPILSAAAWSTVDQSSIYQPNGWSWRLLDASAQNWSNSSGNSLFDSPYKVLEWYVTDKNVPGDWGYNWNYQYGLAPQFTQDEVLGWLANSPDNDPVRFFHNEELDADGNVVWLSQGTMWNEGIAPAFGFLAYSGKTLSPDQTGWDLIIQDYTYTTTYTPLPPRIGDPDDPLKSSGVGAIALPSAPTAVPEPGSFPLFAAALAALGIVAQRKKRAHRA